MSEERRPFVIKRKKIVQAHHGGSWKIALADFMTAMMALFLVMWLLATSSPTELEGIEEYFRTPLLVAMAGGDKPTASTSAIPGGGPDPAFSKGEKARVDLRQHSRPAEIQRSFMDLRKRIESVMMADPDLRDLRKQVKIYLVPEGLLIQVLDSERRPMFDLSSDEVEPYMSKLLRTIAPLLNELPNELMISGHTDSVPYRERSKNYSNWELSTDRANASRRELMAGGLNGSKLLWVVGMADEVPLPDTDAADPVNRRIEVMVLNQATAAKLRRRHTNTVRDLANGT